ncbi:MAG: hypothetical protein AB2374_06635 [Cytobacillus gottheilii]|uniref:hypothetical protein n=1 Tax=Cytobacillus gottheilii TaxID=859144 RepID=UPI0034649CFE
MASLTKDIDGLFEQLKSTEPRPITDILEKISKKDGTFHSRYSSGWKIKNINNPALPSCLKEGGIYVFWRMNDQADSLKPFYDEEQCSRKYTLQGKKITSPSAMNMFQQVEIEITDDWLERYKGHIPLYVGKNTDCLLKRFTLHLQINHEQYKGKTTSNQLRRGIKTLFPNSHTTDLIVNHIGYTVINLHGYENAVNRFYLEDYLIGKLLPLFNIDIER